MPYLSIKQRFLLFIIATLLFGLTPAIHAEGLSGLKDSLNKGEIDSTLIEQTKQQSDISDVPPNSISADKPATKLQTPVKKVQIKKPARIKEVQVKKSSSRLKRIGAPIKTPDKDSYSFSISEFPAIDESKYNPEAIKALKAMREKATGYGNVEYDLSDFCVKYSAYTELCNLGRLYVIQQKLKIGKTYDLTAQKYLEELTGEFVYGSNEVTSFINNEVNQKMIPVLNDYDNKVIERQHAYALKEVDRLQKELSDMIKNSVFKPADLEILKAQVTASYKKMIEAYLGMKITNDYNLAEAQKFINEITKFYNSLPLKVKIKFQESPDKPPVEKEISVTKDGRTFVNYLYSYIDAKLQHCQYSTDDKEFNSILNGKSENSNNMATLDDFIVRINNQPAGEIAFTQAEKDTYIKNIENYRQNVAKIKRIYFQKDISYGTLLPDYIAKTNECILLKAEIIFDPENHDIKILTPPVKVELLSNVSKISSEVTLKKSAIAKGYCAVIGNINANLWPINDKPDAQKESIAVLSGYAEDTKDGKYLYDSIYFDTKLIYSTMGTTTIDIQQQIIPSSESFCQAGGGEFMTITSKDNKNIKANIIIKNQAKWFVIEAHGDPDNGSIQYGLSNGNRAILKFGQAKEIFKDNIDVLFLNSCYCLSYDTTEAEVWVKGWHKTLPQGLIAGYHNLTYPNVTLAAFESLAQKLDKFKLSGNILTKHEIGQVWLNVNIDFYNKNSIYNKMWLDAYGVTNALNARYILNENNEEHYKYWYIGRVMRPQQKAASTYVPLFYKIKE